MATAQANIRCPGCGAHIEVKATVPSDDPQMAVPEEWTAWHGGECPESVKNAKIDCRFIGGIENYSFCGWSVQWAEGDPNRIAFYRRACPADERPSSFTRWK